jgi:hypothetical protein
MCGLRVGAVVVGRPGADDPGEGTGGQRLSGWPEGDATMTVEYDPTLSAVQHLTNATARQSS